MEEQELGGAPGTPDDGELEDDVVDPAGADPIVKITDEEADVVEPGSVPDEASGGTDGEDDEEPLG